MRNQITPKKLSQELKSALKMYKFALNNLLSMKRYILFIVLSACSLFTQAKPLPMKAYLSTAAFYSPQHGPYLETYLSILGRSVQFVKNSNGKFQGTLNITMLFKQNDSIKDFRKYQLLSSEIDDTTHINFIIFDQQRISLAKGTYNLELQISDVNRNAPAFTAKDSIEIPFTSTSVFFSGIEPVESYSKASESSAMAKSGYEFIPYQDYFYPQNIQKLTFYSELYNAADLLGADGQFAITSSIHSIESGKPVDNYFRIKRETAKDVNVIFNEFDLTHLPTGIYDLVLEARDKENKLLASRSLFFQRSNPAMAYNTSKLSNIIVNSTFASKYTNADSLREYVRMSFPIAGANEKLFIQNNLKSSSLLNLQQFFLDFWVNRNAADPEFEWNKYRETVAGVEKEFGSTYKKGYETDRGRVYLQYGPPNQRTAETMNPATFPFEIWHYYKIGDQSDIKFVFYTRDRALNDYQLAHSSARGEVKNVNWQYEIKRAINPRDTNNDLYTKPLEEDTWGEHTGEYYNLRK